MLWAGLQVAVWITQVGGKCRHGLPEKSLSYESNFVCLTKVLSQMHLPLKTLFGGGKSKKHKQLFGIVPGMGGVSNLFMSCVFLGEKGNTLTKFPGNLTKGEGYRARAPSPLEPRWFFKSFWVP